MINFIKNIIFSLVILILICASCVKDEIEQIDNTLTFKPEYSLPIGKKEIALKDFITTNLDPDTAGIPAEYIFYYDNNYFRSPLNLYWHDFVDFDFSKLTNKFDSIESLMFRVNIVNKIPAQIKLMLSFSNADATGTDILFSNFTIESAQFSENGSIIPSEQYKNDFYFDKNRALAFFDKKSININLRLIIINPTDEIIKYLSTQSLEVQFALRFSFESTSNEI